MTEPTAVTSHGTIPPAADESVNSTSQSGIRAMWESWTNRVFTMREDRFFLFLAVLIGILSGLAVVCFRIAIEWTQIELLGSSISPTFPRVILAPTLAGFAVALLVIYAFPRARGSGVNQTKSAVYVSNGYIPFNTVVGKFITCALAIGSGQSLGPEDPRCRWALE